MDTKNQVKCLSLELNEIRLDYKKSPEIAVKKHFLELSKHGMASFCEGTSIFTLISCSCFEVIRDAWHKYFTEDYKYIDFGGSCMKDRVDSYTYRSQAIRLPKEFRFDVEEVYIEKIENKVILSPKPDS